MNTTSDKPATLFADLIIPVPIPRLFTYCIPEKLHDTIAKGKRVIVPFGKKKILTGIVFSIHQNPPTAYQTKTILELIDTTAILYDQQFKLYQWIAEYYLCTLGEVMIAALPSGLKLSSQSMVQLNPNFDFHGSAYHFSEKEEILLQHLRSRTLTYSQISTLLNGSNIFSILRSLQSKDIIILFEQVHEKYKPKTEKQLRLTPQYILKKTLEELFSSLADKPKQEAIVLKYLQHVPIFSHPELNQLGCAKSQIMDDTQSDSSLRTLIKNNIMEEFDIVVPRFQVEKNNPSPLLVLSQQQEYARDQILETLIDKKTTLLHGVTGSGKTEIYIDLIRQVLAEGYQILYLLPEIALTTQIVFRLKKMFGTDMGVYHSKFSDNERVDIWKGVLDGTLKLIVGVRSAIFLPFDNIGLVIIDEEHDSSYKQQDPAPRYHARDTALMMAQIHNAKVLLGSATPSIESYYHACIGKFGWVELTHRYGQAQLPEIVLIDLVKERKRKSMKGEFSTPLLDAIRNSIAKQEQVILFQNRRGYSPIIECQDCGWIPNCIHCSVSLTYHQYRKSIVCHYCGYQEILPGKCPVCASSHLQTMGYGTEKLEEELHLHFPDAKVLRMDLETTRTKLGYETILKEFETGDTDILVGTQMVTKGLDFDRVNLVGIFDADRTMHFPNFRSYERAFQLIMQVSGRSGRRREGGKVIIQTSSPQHFIFTYAKQHDVIGFIQNQLTDRQNYLYPPYSRLIEITLKHVDKKITNEAANLLCKEIKTSLKDIHLVGPGEPMISKIRNEFLMTLLLKIPRNDGNLSKIKTVLNQLANPILLKNEYRTLKIVFDVDPI